MSTDKHLTGPSWDNSSEYPTLHSPELYADLSHAEELTASLAALGKKLSPLVAKANQLSGVEREQGVCWAQEATILGEKASILLRNVATYLSCELSVDGKNAAAKTLAGKAEALEAQLGQAYNALEQLLKLADDQFIEAYLKPEAIAPHRFHVMHERQLQDQALSLAEEDLIIGLNVNGPKAWGNLYDNLSGSIEVSLDLPTGHRQVGLAEAASLSQDSDDRVREAAFRGTERAWEAHEESAAAILNALGGWRLDLYKRRSHTKPVHFLDAPLHTSRITKASLEAMMGAVQEAVPLGQRVLSLQAKLLGKQRLAPWDLFAPCPPKGACAWRAPSYDEAISLISEAFASIHPDMGEFVQMMAKNRWIEGTVGPTKRPGAYCTQFAKSRTPRVYMTYTGGMRELKTLAHELGHAFHNWVMRDMPVATTNYPMTLAETASIFGETVVNQALINHAKAAGDLLNFTWAQAREVESLLLNIPARFAFEQAFYERRAATILQPADLKKLMKDSWAAWYGDGLSEGSPMFWASKLHFSISELSFYNFPYTFGYLFSLGVYAQRQQLGTGFYPAYVSLLRDSGSMSAEAVALKHLGADLTKADFWRQSLKIAAESVRQFEAAAAAAL